MSSDKEQGKKASQEAEEERPSSSSKVSLSSNPVAVTTDDDAAVHDSTVATPQSQQLSQSTTTPEKKATAAGESTTYPSTPERPRPRQVIAVSASKGPAAFFNLARKFLVTDEMCDLSALEGAIVSAADAAHLLERSKLATIVRVQTSYVVVEPKQRRRNQPQEAEGSTPAVATTPYSGGGGRGRSSAQRDVRRARIVITVQRTDSYKRWLEANPLQAVIAGDGDEGHDTEEGIADVVGSSG